MRSLVFLAALVPMFAGANECRFTAQHDFEVDAAGLNTVAFALGSTDVTVEGVPGLAKVEVRGKAWASDQAWLAELTVDQQRSGDRVTITPHERHDTNGSWFHSSYAYIKLHVRVPAALAVDIKGSSGDADVSNVASVDVRRTSSGDLTLHDVRGDVKVARSGSGDLAFDTVSGSVGIGSVG